MASLRKRSNKYYAQYYVGGCQRRVSLNTENYQVAREKLRQLESALALGDDSPLPTRTPIGEVLNRYVEHIRTVKRPKSAQTEVYYLRSAFGAICPALEITSRKPSAKARKRPPKPGMGKRRRVQVIEAPCLNR